jgi:hypothetical protein
MQGQGTASRSVGAGGIDRRLVLREVAPPIAAQSDRAPASDAPK